MNFLVPAALAANSIINSDFRPRVLPTGDLFNVFIPRIVNFTLAIVGFFAVAVLIFAGVRLIASQGDTDQAKSAKMMVLYAIIGLILIVLSYTIVAWITGGDSFLFKEVP